MKFKRFREKYTQREKELKAAIREREVGAKELLAMSEEMKLRIDEFKEKMSIDRLDRSLISTFIDRILVCEAGRG